MNSSARYPIESVENAARVLLMLRKTRLLRVGEVADELGVARSSAHRMLATLQAQGLLKQDAATRGYHAGFRLVELGLAVIGATDLRAEARPVLESLAKTTRETVHLIVLEGTQIVFVDGVEGDHVIRAALRVGDRAPAHAAAAGKVLLAALPEEELRSRYPQTRLRGGTDLAIATRADLEAELALIRKRGYATNCSESEDGLHAVAAAVFDGGGAAQAALSVSGPSSRLSDTDLDRLGSVVLAACGRLG